MRRSFPRCFRTFFLLAAGLAISGPVHEAAAQRSIVIPLLPASMWRLESARKLRLQDLTQLGDQAGVDQELGVQSGIERTYRMEEFQTNVILEEATDPSSAYSLFTLYQNSRMKPVPGVALAVADPEIALMTRGRYFIRILRPTTPVLTDEDFISLLTTIGGAKISIENKESLPTPLPHRGLVQGSTKYMLGPAAANLALPSIPSDIIGFEDGVEAKAGIYVSSGAHLELVEISYPTPQIASKRFEQMKSALRMNQDVGRDSVYGKRAGSDALLVLNAKSQVMAKSFLGQFKINEIVSSVPPFPHKGNFALQIVKLVLANAELVVIIFGLAFLGGIAIYLTKLLIMKTFPKSAWVRPDDEILIKIKLT